MRRIRGLVPGFFLFEWLAVIGGNGQKYRTLLSYQRFLNESRILFFSNPHARYESAAVGASMADNSRTINETTATVAGYR